MAKVNENALLTGPEPNHATEARFLTKAEEAVLKVFVDPEYFSLCREDKRKKTRLVGRSSTKAKPGSRIVSKQRFNAITKDPWFIQQYRDAIVQRVGENLGPLLEASLTVAQIKDSSAGFQDRKMLLQMMGIYRESRDSSGKGPIGVNINIGERLGQSIKRVRETVAGAATQTINGDDIEVKPPKPVESSHQEYSPMELDEEADTVI